MGLGPGSSPSGLGAVSVSTPRGTQTRSAPESAERVVVRRMIRPVRKGCQSRAGGRHPRAHRTPAEGSPPRGIYRGARQRGARRARWRRGRLDGPIWRAGGQAQVSWRAGGQAQVSWRADPPAASFRNPSLRIRGPNRHDRDASSVDASRCIKWSGDRPSGPRCGLPCPDPKSVILIMGRTPGRAAVVPKAVPRAVRGAPRAWRAACVARRVRAAPSRAPRAPRPGSPVSDVTLIYS